MKTISELEAEVFTLKNQELQLWEKIKEQNKVLDSLTAPWMEAGARIHKLNIMIETRKQMEAAQ